MRPPSRIRVHSDVPDLPLVPPPITTPCALQSTGLDPAAQRSEATEGLHIGSPEMLTYLDAMGYPTAPADPTKIFSNPDSAVQRLRQQIDAQEAAG